MILHIDTTDQKKVIVSLKNNGSPKANLAKGGEVVKTLIEENQVGSQVLLPLIEKILKLEKLAYKDLKGIEVETGPGSFTGIRVGVSVANAFGFSLGIPVNGKKIEDKLVY